MLLFKLSSTINRKSKENFNVKNSALLGLEGKKSCPVTTVEFIHPSLLWILFMVILPSVLYFLRLIFHFRDRTENIYIISLSYLKPLQSTYFGWLQNLSIDCFNSHLLSSNKSSNKILPEKMLWTMQALLILFYLAPDPQQQCLFLISEGFTVRRKKRKQAALGFVRTAFSLPKSAVQTYTTTQVLHNSIRQKGQKERASWSSGF